MPSPSREKSDLSRESLVSEGSCWIRWADASVTEAPAPVNFCPVSPASILMSVDCGLPVKAAVPSSLSLLVPSGVVIQTWAASSAATPGVCCGRRRRCPCR